MTKTYVMFLDDKATILGVDRVKALAEFNRHVQAGEFKKEVQLVEQKMIGHVKHGVVSVVTPRRARKSKKKEEKK